MERISIMGSKIYKVMTAQNQDVFVEADRVELDMPLNRVTFYLDGVPTGSFAGYMNFSVHNPELHAQFQAQAAQEGTTT